MNKMKILVKFPSRGRPLRFFQSLNTIYENASSMENIYVYCTLDKDDGTMFNDAVIKNLRGYENLYAVFSQSKSKIHAVNRDMDTVAVNAPPAVNWDILVLMSDDMRFTMPNWDEILRSQFEINGLDTMLHVPDQDAKEMLATMYIAGRKFYERFGYIYDPRFKSLWCDNLVMDIAKILGKYKFLDFNGMIEHLNPAYGHLERDEMFNQQQELWGEDEAMYHYIKGRGYELDKLINAVP